MPMQKRRKLRVVLPRLVRDERIRFEHRFEPFFRGSGLVADQGEPLEVARDLPAVPSTQDRLDVGEILVQRRTPNAVFFAICAMVTERTP
jgi:hypothetical protein